MKTLYTFLVPCFVRQEFLLSNKCNGIKREAGRAGVGRLSRFSKKSLKKFKKFGKLDFQKSFKKLDYG
jgi:hypothetical protein